MIDPTQSLETIRKHVGENYDLDDHDAAVVAIVYKLASGTVLNYPGYPPLKGKCALDAEQLKDFMIEHRVHPREVIFHDCLTGEKVRLLYSNFPHFIRLYGKEIREALKQEEQIASLEIPQISQIEEIAEVV